MHFSSVIKIGETVWPRLRVASARSDKVALQNGNVSLPYADKRCVHMLVIS